MNAFAALTPMLRVLHLFVTLAMIGVVLIQRSEGGGLGIGSTQGMGAFMSGRGTANLLTRTTAILGTLFFAISLALALLNKGTTGVGHDILTLPTPATATAPRVPGPSVPGPAPATLPARPAATAPAVPATPQVPPQVPPK
jgi:preprotein translocase subunit SecG